MDSTEAVKAGAAQLGIDELQAEEIVTGSCDSGSSDLQADPIVISGSGSSDSQGRIFTATSVFRGAAKASAKMMERFVQRADDAAIAAEVAKATEVAKAMGVPRANADVADSMLDEWAQALVQSAHQSCKAQTVAWKASKAVKDSLEKQAAALWVADKAHQAFRWTRDRCQEEASANQRFAVNTKDEVPVASRNGICAFSCDHHKGDILSLIHI